MAKAVKAAAGVPFGANIWSYPCDSGWLRVSAAIEFERFMGSLNAVLEILFLVTDHESTI